MSLPDQIHAVVLAGTHTTPRHRIRGQNKAFLTVAGRPILERIVEALDAAERIAQVYVVGPVERLNRLLAEHPGTFVPIPEGRNFIDNAWRGYLATYPQDAPKDRDRPIIYLTADIPLITPAGVDDFVRRCAVAGSDFCLGICYEAELAPYHPRPGKRGLRRPWTLVRDAKFRLANISLVRPEKLERQEMIEAGFSARRMREWTNLLKAAFLLFKWRCGPEALSKLAVLGAASLLDRRGLGSLAQPFRQLCPLDSLERCISRLVGIDFVGLRTPFGGLAIDVDEERDLEIIEENFAEWYALQGTIDPASLPLPHANREPASSPAGG